MKPIKLIILLSLAVAAVYLGLMAVIQVTLARQYPRVENELKQSLGLQSVQVRRFFNLPFLFVTARNITLQIDEFTSVHVDRVRVRYSLLSGLFRGPASIIKRIRLGQVEVTGSLGSVLKLFNSPSESTSPGTNTWLKQVRTSIVLKDLQAQLKVIGQITAELQLTDLMVRINNEDIRIQSGLYLNLNKTNRISYAKAGMDINLHFRNLTELKASGQVSFRGVNVAGVNILKLSPLSFSYGPDFQLKLGASPLSSILSQSNSTVYIRISQIFSLAYEPFAEFYLLEHMFDPGVYKGILEIQLGEAGTRVYTRVSGTNQTGPALELQGRQTTAGFLLQGRADTPKYGMGMIDLSFIPGNDFPSGRVESRNLEVIPGLGVTAQVRLEASSNRLLVAGREVFLNGGRIGSTGSLLTLDADGGVTFSPVSGYLNAPVQGRIGRIDYELNIGIRDVPGSALVNNIGFDIFNLGRGVYQGGMKIFNQGMAFRISGQLQGRLDGRRLVRATLELTDDNLRLPEIYFYESDLATALDLEFTRPAIDRTLITLNGNATLSGKFRLPVNGTVVSVNRSKNATVKLDFDRNIHLQIRSLNQDSQIRIQTSAYSLATFGLPGLLDADIQVRLKNTVLDFTSLLLQYSYLGRRYALKVQTEPRQGSTLNLRQFVLEMDKEKVFGNGRLWETKNRLNARVDFLRGGGLKFESSFEKINGLLNLKNIYISDFLQEKQDVYLSFNMNFSGDLVFPNFTISQLSLLNSVTSDPFNLRISDIRRVPGTLTLGSIQLRSPDLSVRLSSEINFLDKGPRISAQGKIALADILQADVRALYQEVSRKGSLNYQLDNLLLGRENLGSLAGVVTFADNKYAFTSTSGNTGLNGFYHDRQNKEWDFRLGLPRLRLDSQGSVKGERLSGKLSCQADLRLLSFMDDVFRTIGGQAALDLDLQGSVRDPKYAGMITLDKTELSIVNLNMDVRNFKGQIPVQNSKLIFRDFRLPTTTGTFLFDGYVEMSLLQVAYIDLFLKPFPGNDAWLSLGMQTPFIKLLGNLYVRKVHVFGSPFRLNLEGEATARNANIFVGLQSDTGPVQEGIIEGIIWNLKVNMGNGVKFGNQFIDTTLSAGQSLFVLGSIGDGSLSLKGDVDVSRGTITFLEQDFQIREGTASFNGQPGDPLPYINVQTELVTRDQTGERIRVYLTFEGKLSKISLKDFYSVPDRNRNELFALLGFQPFQTESSGTNQSPAAVRNMTMGGWNALENTFIFNPIANTLRRSLGLDLVSIRSQALGNIFENTIFGSATNIDAISIIEGTSLTFGKYLFSNLFVEYELSFERNDLSTLGLSPMHSVGVGLDWQNFFLGWKYGPQELGSGLKYEHSLDFQFHRKF